MISVPGSVLLGSHFTGDYPLGYLPVLEKLNKGERQIINQYIYQILGSSHPFFTQKLEAKEITKELKR